MGKIENGSDMWKEDDLRSASLCVEDITSFTCSNCCKEDSETVALQKCSKCGIVYYCGTECQTTHWEHGHKGECKQLRILRKYHAPYAKEIREAMLRHEISCDDDGNSEGDVDRSTSSSSSSIPSDDATAFLALQTLRSKLGLTTARNPTESPSLRSELLQRIELIHLADEEFDGVFLFHDMLLPESNGKVQIGSTSKINMW